MNPSFFGWGGGYVINLYIILNETFGLFEGELPKQGVSLK